MVGRDRECKAKVSAEAVEEACKGEFKRECAINWEDGFTDFLRETSFLFFA